MCKTFFKKGELRKIKQKNPPQGQKDRHAAEISEITFLEFNSFLNIRRCNEFRRLQAQFLVSFYACLS